MNRVKAETEDVEGTWHYVSMLGSISKLRGNGNVCNWIGQGTYVYTTKGKEYKIETYIKGVEFVSNITPPIIIKYDFDKLTKVELNELNELYKNDNKEGIINFANQKEIASYRICCSISNLTQAFNKWKKDTKK